jgi:hypothetical protein
MPDWNDAIRARLRGLNLQGARETEIVEELAQHLELVMAGLPNGRHTRLRWKNWRRVACWSKACARPGNRWHASRWA